MRRRSWTPKERFVIGSNRQLKDATSKHDMGLRPRCARGPCPEAYVGLCWRGVDEGSDRRRPAVGAAEKEPG